LDYATGNQATWPQRTPAAYGVAPYRAGACDERRARPSTPTRATPCRYCARTSRSATRRANRASG